MKAIGTGVVRDRGGNSGTRIATVVRAPVVDFAALFAAAYPAFAPACRAVGEPGVAVIAVDEQRRNLAGMTVLRAQPARHTAVIVGRHDRCDLALEGHADLPLRQLAVVLDPVASWAAGRAQVQYRVVDLRSERGLHDEAGRTIRGLRCDGASVLRCAGYALFVLPLGDPSDWPDAGADAWACLPERVYFDEVTHLARGSSTRVPNFPPGDHHRRTRITAVRGPHESRAHLVTDGDLVGTLELCGPDRKQLLSVGEAALRDGVLLGRYDRCDRAFVGDESVSRVHALLIQIGAQLLVVDTASTYGTERTGAGTARVHAIAGDAELTLGTETTAHWRPCS